MTGIFAEIVNVSSSIFVCTVLERIKNNAYETEEEMQQAAEQSDLLDGLVGLGTMIILIIGGIVFLVWTYRFVKNAHCLSRRPLRFGPGWACGYYFIPILNLFRPYQALADAYRASVQPNNWKQAAASSLIGWWWGIHIINIIIWRATLKFNMRIQRSESSTIEDLLFGNALYIVDGTATILLNILTLFLVRKLYKAQTNTYEYVAANPQILENELSFTENEEYEEDEPVQDEDWIIPTRVSGWAIAAGYAGLFAVLFVTAPVALILGIIALRDVNHRNCPGKGRAIFGLVMGSIFTLLLLAFLALLIISSFMVGCF
ncbi:hypothetical protein FACS189454_09950 [Planctomycetales bacterium]|nr:hypothetical protein FACS189454_09950 [Planctomycetales bacterium]